MQVRLTDVNATRIKRRCKMSIKNGVKLSAAVIANQLVAEAFERTESTKKQYGRTQC
jgi:hypothetical protein